MEEFKNFIKTLWQNKRRRAALGLVFWVIFFIVVFAMIGGPGNIPEQTIANGNNNTTSSSFLENYDKMSNFEYSYLITIKKNNVENTYKIDGTYYDKKYYFTMSNDEYYIADNILYVVNNDERKLIEFNSIDSNHIFNLIDIRLLGKDNVHTFIDASEEDNKTTYKDGSVLIDYVYKSYDNRILELTVSEYSNIINSIELDFHKYFEEAYDEFNVSIAYKNINNIAEYQKNYDEYEIIKKGD